MKIPFCFEPRIGNAYTGVEIEGVATVTGFGHDDMDIEIDIVGGGPGCKRVDIGGNADPMWKAIRKAIIDDLHERIPDQINDAAAEYVSGVTYRQRGEARGKV